MQRSLQRGAGVKPERSRLVPAPQFKGSPHFLPPAICHSSSSSTRDPLHDHHPFSWYPPPGQGRALPFRRWHEAPLLQLPGELSRLLLPPSGEALKDRAFWQSWSSRGAQGAPVPSQVPAGVGHGGNDGHCHSKVLIRPSTWVPQPFGDPSGRNGSRRDPELCHEPVPQEIRPHPHRGPQNGP